MAKSELLIPFIVSHEAGIDLKFARRVSLHAMICRAFATGYSEDPHDRGGATFTGVTLDTYRAFCRRKNLPEPSKNDLRNMPAEHWGEIFRTGYWDRWLADLIPSQRVANILVDFVWASGIYGIKVPQRVLGVKPDGKVGPVTLRALCDAIEADEQALVDRLIQARLDYVDRLVARNPSQRRFINGWKRRIKALATYLAALSLPAMLVSCGAPRAAVVVDAPTLHTADSLRAGHVSVTRLDTVDVTVRLPQQHADRLTNDSVSRLETDHALSQAWIAPDGRLGHSLLTKPVPLHSQVTVPRTSDTITRTITRIREVPVPVATPVPAKLSRWQQWRLNAFWWLAAAVALMAGRKLLPRLLASFRYLCCYLM
ncbi:MAG: hypothetical protein NC187_00750 [Candidatus Amulumruptor caecigallinarius]|nr:hypothetical protein [Candidatus Amulumruptor caecigallinarius]MCM1396004.1 hypothetical protein [Candidatus Amulumruptor caecigallinarius]MCM1454560.1 hypothetical protein [bacterium]